GFQPARSFGQLETGPTLLLRPHAAEPDRIAPKLGGHGTTRGGADSVRGISVRAPANHPFLGIGGDPGTTVGGSVPVVRVSAVGAPLPDIAVHVIKTPGVGQLLAYRRVVA